MSSAHPSVPWPPDLTPEKTPIHNFSELRISAPPAEVWKWLVGISLWPQYNPDISGIVLLDANATELALGAPFQWRRRGYTLLSVVTDYLPYARLGWTVDGLWLRGFQEWLLTADGDGCLVRVEDTLAGFVPRIYRNGMSRGLNSMQQRWLETLRRVSEAGPPA